MGKWRFQMYDLVIGRKWFAWLPIFDLTTDEVLRAIRRISLLGWGLEFGLSGLAVVYEWHDGRLPDQRG